MLPASQAPQVLNTLAWAATALAAATAVVGLLAVYLAVQAGKRDSRMAAEKTLLDVLKLMVRYHEAVRTHRGTEHDRPDDDDVNRI